MLVSPFADNYQCRLSNYLVPAKHCIHTHTCTLIYRDKKREMLRMALGECNTEKRRLTSPYISLFG